VGQWQKLLVKSLKETQALLSARGIKKTDDVIRKVMNVLLVSPEFTKRGKISLADSAWSRIEKVFGESLSNELRQVFIEQINDLREFNIGTEGEFQQYFRAVDDMGAKIRGWRTSFYSIILRVTDLLKQLPEYQSNEAQVLENQEALYFDTKIGEKEK
jgi:hypothetical protein